MKRLIIICFLVIVALVSVRSLFSPGFFPMHDDTQIGRVITMGRALRLGQFPVRWVSDLGYGYGYPIFNFYGPLPYYIGGAVYSFGISGLTATKIMIVIGVLLGTLSMYVCVSRFLGEEAGVLSSVAFTFALYHSVELYVRGAIGEYWAISFFPLFLLGILESIQKKRIAPLILGLSLFGIILSHTLYGYVTVLIGVGLLVIAGIIGFRKRDYRIFRSLGTGFVIGLTLSCFFWLPAFSEMKYTDVASQVSATADFHDHFVCLGQLWNSTWGYGGSIAGCTDGLSFSLGKALLFLALAGFFVGLFTKRLRFYSVIGGIISFVSLFFVLPLSLPVWEVLPFMAYFQYPWRFLGAAIVGLSYLAGIGVAWIPNKAVRIVLTLVFAIGIVLVEGRYFAPQYLYVQNPEVFESAADLRFRVSKISDEYLPREIIRPQSLSELPHGTIDSPDSITLKPVIDRDVYKKYELTAQEPGSVKVNIAAFPGWVYIVNGQKATVTFDHGLPTVAIPKGFSTMELRFTDTTVRLVGNVISIIAASLVLIIYGKKTIA